MESSSRHISIVIERSAAEVYAFASDARNLPAWAGGLAGSEVTWDGMSWSTDSPMGRVSFVFAPVNEFGILDHTVTLPSGESVYNPLRVLAHEDGAEVVFTLRPSSGMSPEGFERDARMVQQDLARLKSLLEAQH
ncbi:MAG TPA: SRPBCC family protein [Jatrophihabitans sp.]|jgi:hypothetical protein